jgi:hypothetical protein
MDALKAYRDNLAITERLAAADRSNARWQSDLAYSYEKLSSVYLRLGTVVDGLAALHKARNILAAVVSIAPTNAEWNNDLTWLDYQNAFVEGMTKACMESPTARIPKAAEHWSCSGNGLQHFRPRDDGLQQINGPFETPVEG